MKQIICDGPCKKSEELTSGMQGKTIVGVKLVIDERESQAHASDIHNADLCPDCRQNMLNSYFRGNVDTNETVLPQSLRADA